jgi:predicted Zn-dependent peptidase
MYGAGFGFDVYKRGNNHIIQFRMDTIDDRFTQQSNSSSLLRQTLAFLGQTVTQPAMEQGGFVRKYVESEIHTVRKKLESVINDKVKYASERCMQEMFPNDPYRLNPLGLLQHLEGLNAQDLFQFYRTWLTTAPLDLYVVGNTTLEEVRTIVEEEFQVNVEEPYTYHIQAMHKRGDEVHTVTEQLDINQGKLNMGLRFPVTYQDDEYPIALMYNGILGGYAHSKLFIHVREKASLAYYSSSRFDGYKGMIMIQSGIEFANYEKAVGIIKEQIEAMRQGQIADLELSQTKAMIINQLREINDGAFEMIAFDFNTVLTQTNRTVPDLIQRIEGISKEDIQRIAQQAQLDTIYFLRDRKGE